MFFDKYPLDCGSCSACCKNQFVALVPDDGDPSRYKTMKHESGAVLIAQHFNGDCVYLENGKCSIYDDRPTVCRTYDCRAMAVVCEVTKIPIPKDIANAAMERLSVIPVAKVNHARKLVSQRKHHMAKIMASTDFKRS